jgi:predicted phosphodiesterase
MPTRIAFFTDLHLRGQGPSSRQDDYPQSILNKLEYCLKRSSEKADAALFGGDFCHSYRLTSDGVKEKAIQIFDNELKVPFFYTWGQHDLFGKDYETRHDSAKAFILRQVSRVVGDIEEVQTDKDVVREINGAKVSILGCPSGFDPIAWSKRMSRRNPKNADCRIAVVHHLLTTEETKWLIPIDEFDGSGFDVVICGDLHQGFPPIKTDSGCLFLNPGSLARTQKTAQDMAREIRGVDIVIEDDGTVGYEFWPVECAGKGEEVFKPNAPVIEEEINIEEDNSDSEEIVFEEVVDALGSIGISKIDVWDMLEKKAMEAGLDEKIIKYILSKRPDA